MSYANGVEWVQDSVLRRLARENFSARIKCANDRRAAIELKSWKHFPRGVFIRIHNGKLCVFELLLFGHFSFLLRTFFFFLSHVHFVWAVLQRNASPTKVPRISEGSDTDPNGLVDSLKFYHCVLSAWRIQPTKQNHNVGSATTIHRHREQCKTFQKTMTRTCLTHFSRNTEEVLRFTENEAYQFSFDA